jgi:Protein of unknown function (DUF3662)/FHA domain
MRFIRKAGAPAEKSPKRLYVEPAELARKLVKEMDDHVVEKGDRLVARSRYTIYVCPEDYENLLPRSAKIIADLKAKLTKHVDSMEYFVPGELMVELVLDEQLELGYFGILAQKGSGSGQRPAPDVAPQYVPETPAMTPQQVAPVAPAMTPQQMAPVTPAAPLWDPEPVAPAAAGAEVAAPAAAMAAAAEAAPAQPARNVQSPTEVIPAAQADEMGLEGRVIMITSGDQVMQFRQSRVVIGRGKEADLRVNDPNVSRKHAAVYWSNGRLMVDDLSSTNGTMVNGYPVTRTMLRPTDVVAIGESRLTVEGK